MTQKNQNRKISFLPLVTALLGAAAGSILTFQWNDIANFFGTNAGVILLSALFIIAFSLIIAIIIFRIIKSYSTKIDTSLEDAIEELKAGKDYRVALTSVLEKAGPIMALWSLQKTLRMVLLCIGVVLGGIITIQQNKLLQEQNDKFEIQNKYFKAQNELIELEAKDLVISKSIDDMAKLYRVDMNKIRRISKEFDGLNITRRSAQVNKLKSVLLAGYETQNE